MIPSSRASGDVTAVAQVRYYREGDTGDTTRTRTGRLGTIYVVEMLIRSAL